MPIDTSPHVTGGAIVSDILGMNDSLVKVHRVQDGGGFMRYDGVESSNPVGDAIARVHSRYLIPDDQEPELHDLIQEYERARLAFQRAYGRWQTERGKHGYDLEFMLEEEGNDLYSLTAATEEFEQACQELSRFLSRFEVGGNGEKKMQRWRSQEVRVYADPDDAWADQ